ncbi:hypothetical protein ACFLQ7_03100 [Actinomycetota bacterium]
MSRRLLGYRDFTEGLPFIVDTVIVAGLKSVIDTGLPLPAPAGR